MAWIDTVPDDEAEGELAELFARHRDPESGRVDHILAVHGLHPAGLAAHVALYTTVMRGTQSLPKVDRELVAFVVSADNRCRY